MPSHYAGSPSEKLALDTYIKLVRATDSVMGRIARGGTLGMSPSQFAVLECLYHLGPLPQNDIASKLLKSGSNMTLVIGNLEKQNLVHRERSSEDRRVVNVSLSDEGRQRIVSLLPTHVAAIVDEMNALTPDEQRLLGDLCRKLGRKVTTAEGKD